MAPRDILGGVTSTLLMLGKIGLCVLFAVHDRFTDRLQRSGDIRPDRPPLAALERH